MRKAISKLGYLLFGGGLILGGSMRAPFAKPQDVLGINIGVIFLSMIMIGLLLVGVSHKSYRK